jgi:hypothetical protein
MLLPYIIIFIILYIKLESRECMFAYSPRTDNRFEPNLACLFPETRKRFYKGQNSESVLGSKPGEGGFCILETKHDRITSPRPKFFVSTRILQESWPQPRETVMGLSPGEDGFCSSETKHDRRTAQRTKLFVSARILQEKRVTNPKTVLGSSPGEAGFWG